MLSGTLVLAGVLLERRIDSCHLSNALGKRSGLLVLLWLLMYLSAMFGFWPRFPILPEVGEELALLLHPRAEFRMGLALRAIPLVAGAWLLFRIIRNRMQGRAIEAHSQQLEQEVQEDQGWPALSALLSGIEEKLRRDSGHSRLRLRVSDQIRAPLTLGWRSPVIYVPLWMFQDTTAIPLRLLMNREALRVRLGHHVWIGLLGEIGAVLPPMQRLAKGISLALELWGDRIFQQSVSPQVWVSFLQASSAITAAGHLGDPEVPLGPDPKDVLRRIRHANTRPSPAGWPLFWMSCALAGTLLIGMALGPVYLGDLRPSRLNDLGEGIAFQDSGGQTRVAKLHLPDGAGILLDTSHCRTGFSVLSWAARCQALSNATGTPCIRLELEVVTRRTRPGALVPLAGSGSFEQLFEPAEGLRREVLLAERWIKLQEGQQTVTLFVRHPQMSSSSGTIQTWGPSFYLPAGWHIRILSMRAIPSELDAFTRWSAEGTLSRKDTWMGGVGNLPELHLDWSTDW